MKTYISEYLMNAFTPKKLKTFPPANQCRYCYLIYKILRQMSLRIRQCLIDTTVLENALWSLLLLFRSFHVFASDEKKTIGNSYTSESVSRNILAQFVSSQTQSFSHNLTRTTYCARLCELFQPFLHFQWKQIQRAKLLAEVLSHWTNAPT